MIGIPFYILLGAVLMGAALAVHYARGPTAKRPHPAIPLTHAALGLVGLTMLLFVLRGGLPPTDTGTSDFGGIAAALFGLALAFGLMIAFAAWRGRRPGGVLVGTHASIAIAGFVLLIALVALG